MNIWLNPKYSQTMDAHAGKFLSLYRYGKPSTTTYPSSLGKGLPLTSNVEGEEIVLTYVKA